MDIALQLYGTFSTLYRKSMDNQITDEGVVKKVLGGDQEAFRILVKRYERMIYTLCLRMMRHPQDAEDCAQTSFIKAYSALDRYQSGRAFKTWLYRIAVNVCIDAHRRSKVQPATPSSEEQEDYLTEPGPTPREIASFKELRTAVSRILGKLDEKYRLPLVLFYQEGLECNDVAAMLQLNPATVKTRMRRGRLLLREMLAQQYPDLSLGEVEPL